MGLAVRRKGQLRDDGTLGKIVGYQFVSAETIADRLIRDNSDMSLTIGLSFRNPRTHDKRMSINDAVDWLARYGKRYVFEAVYNGDDDLLHVTALSGNDLY